MRVTQCQAFATRLDALEKNVLTAKPVGMIRIRIDAQCFYFSMVDVY